MKSYISDKDYKQYVAKNNKRAKKQKINIGDRVIFWGDRKGKVTYIRNSGDFPKYKVREEKKSGGYYNNAKYHTPTSIRLSKHRRRGT